MNVSEQCPKGCGETMVRYDETIVLEYRGAYGWRSRPQTHAAWYECSVCGHMYVSSVFKRFKEQNVI